MLPVLSQQIKGVWVHEVQYDLRLKGRHKIEVTIDDIPIPGSPVEFLVKPRVAP